MSDTIDNAKNRSENQTASSYYYPGNEQAHVGQAFQPDLSVLSGWKA
jgi:hypothetical protein